jgi:hypothetical protein
LHSKNGERKRKEADVGKDPHFWKKTVLHNTKKLADTNISVDADFGPETRKLKILIPYLKDGRRRRHTTFTKRDKMVVNGKLSIIC